jgi:hypothetical protein
MSLMTEEQAAQMIADAKAGRFRDTSAMEFVDAWEGPVIDTTGLELDNIDEHEWVLTPPWPAGYIVTRMDDITLVIAYLYEHDALVNCITLTASHRQRPRVCFAFGIQVDEQGKYLGVMTSQAFVDDDSALEEIGVAAGIVCRTLDFCNSTNIAPAVPSRSRAEHRRIERLLGGETIKTLHIWRKGRTTLTPRGEPLNGGVPLSEVRGHWAHYGDCCPGRHDPRGLLFGKYTGRVRKEIHTRGSSDHGKVIHDKVVLHP